MNRREFLAAGAGLTIAVTGGCTGCARSPTGSIRMSAITDAGIARRAVGSLEGPESERRALLEQVVTEGGVTTEGRSPPLPADDPILYEGAVYRLNWTVTNTRTVQRFPVTFEPIRDGESVGDAETVRYADLPAVDREVLARRGFDDTRPPGVGTTLVYPPDAVDESTLVPAPKRPVIIWPNGSARVSVDDPSAVERRTYRYTGERVASAAVYGARLRDRYGFRLSGLSPGEQEIVAEAIEAEEGYIIPPDEELPDDFRELAERFRSQETVPDGAAGTIDGAYIVRYNGATYWSAIGLQAAALTTSDPG